jgi:hypothetical protein
MKKKRLRIVLAILLAISWTISSFPAFRWGDFRFPPELHKAKAAPWTLVGQTTAEIAYGTSDDVTLPGPPQEDDIVIVGLGSDYNSGQCLINTTGYTELFNDGSGGVPVAVLAYKIMGATPDTIVNVQKDGTMRNMAVVIQVWRGVDTTTPIDATRTTGSGSSGMPDSPSYTPVTDGVLVFTVGFLDDDNCTTVTAPTTPSPGFSNLTYESADTDGQGITVMMASLEQVTATTIDPGIFTGTGSTSDDWHAVTFALRPGAAAEPTFTLNDYRWYVDNDSENVTSVWGTPDIAENTAIVIIPPGNDPPSNSQELRLRVNFTVNTANLTATSQQFKLQFKAGTDADCTTGSWTDVGSGAWIFATSGVTDGTDLTVAKLGASDVLQEYAKSNPTATNHNSATTGQDIEYDFHIIGNGGSMAEATQYSFRVLESDNTVFDAYTTCPTLTTEPGTSQLMRHGNLFSEEVEKGFFWTD